MSNIQIPSFDDFLDEMGEDRIAAWADEGNDAMQSFMPVRAPVTPEGASEFATALSAMNQRFAVAMLRDYHLWLVEQLSKVSLRLLK